MPWAWPAEVNVHEAKAFCAWKSERDGTPLRLPSEAEHLLMRPREMQPAALIDAFQSSSGPPEATPPPGLNANLNLAYGTPSAVDAMPVQSTPFGSVVGNVWE